ncbi:MAG: Crp/Fnr family transcriptional regulator [Chroococcidiopsidaceae cyanobacterium CP_BM_RX_35]|nr:Crp/Fnr family transcriptional regulator [Chroococcidiopsidaceae cyanobacterium CP_BM_RX_35]
MLRSPSAKQNRLLAALPEEEYNRLLPYLEWEVLDLKKVLYHPNAAIESVYFPLSGVVSLLTVLDNGELIEVGTIGNEGMVGIPVLLGASRIPGQAICQIPGTAVQTSTEVFKREVVPNTVLYELLHRYTQAMFNQISQTAACNRSHSIQERFCRWILMCHDRADSDQFPLSQEFLAQMLGIRRGSVSKVASIAQNAGLIQYSRGKITILDREGLEATACNCYQVIKTEFERLIGSN